MSIFSLVNEGKLGSGAIRQVKPGQKLERDFYAPNYELIIRAGRGAQPFSITEEVKGFISEISYEDNSDQFDRMEIRLESQIDSSSQRSVMSLTDSKLFTGTVFHYIR